jgi:signal transduction histidine kinase
LDPNTLPFYLTAGALNGVLGILLTGFSRLQPDSRGAKLMAFILFYLAAVFLVAGFGPQLPRWITVIGTNVAIVASTVLFHAGLHTLIDRQPATFDRYGWAVVAISLLPFGYWGIIEPNGIYRSIVFSFTVLAVSARSFVLLLRTARQQPGNIATWVLTGLFFALSLWMLGRGLGLLITPPDETQRGANPTSWLTVFGYMVLITLTTTAILWMEHGQAKPQPTREPATTPEKKLLVLWGIVALFMLATGIGLYQHYRHVEDEEAERSLREARIDNDAFAGYSARIINQVDSLLLAVRGYYQATRSIDATERYIAALGIDHTLMENVWLIDASGTIFLPRKDRALGSFALARDYFAYHRDHADDRLYIGPVLRGQVSGKFQFRLSRRLSHPDGSFAGVILIPVEPRAFAEFYERQTHDTDTIATLIGTDDHKIRARHPQPTLDAFDQAIDSTPLWEALAQAPTGIYRNRSTVDGTERQFVYQRIGTLPLAMVTAYSAADVQTRVVAQLRLIALAALSATGLIVMLALIVTLALRGQKALAKLVAHLNALNTELNQRNEEQDRFLSMLSHELKTPLSVIRMSLYNDSPESRQRVERNIADINAIVERCLQSGRLQHDRIEIATAPCDVDALIQKIVADCHDPQRLVLTPSAPLPPCETDWQLLGIVIANLVDNALKYSPAGSPVTLEAQPAMRADQPGIRIEVSNTAGIAGLPDPEQVFRKYYRAPAAHAKTGSGLGLHLAEGFARKLGGELHYQPQDDTVKFDLWIPRQPPR